MARVALAAGGAIVGGMIGGPWGASIGWTLGGLAGSQLFPPKGANTEGPRLDDLSVDSSAYGAGIPIIFGTATVAGNRIWAKPIEEVASTNRARGKGGGRSRQTTYTYFGSWAVALCAGVAAGVRRIWFDDKLVYDATGGSLQLTLAGLDFRFYPGDETQLPDPLIEADVGAGRAVPHRGLAYLVFERVPLDRLGNRIPVVRAEVVMSGADVSTPAAFASPNGGSVPWPVAVPDWQLRRFFTYNQGAGTINVTSMDSLASSTFASLPLGGSARHMLLVGKYLCVTNGFANTAPIQVFDAYSGAFLRNFGVYNIFLPPANTLTQMSNGDGPNCGVVVYTSGGERHFAILQDFAGAVGSYCIDVDNNAYVWGVDSNRIFSRPRGALWVQGEQRREATDVLSVVGSGGTVDMMRVTFTALTQGVVAGGAAGATVGTLVEYLPALTSAQLGLAAGTITVHAASYDLEDGTFILELSSSGGGSARWCKVSADGALIWAANIAAVSGRAAGDSLLTNGTYGVLANGQQYLYSTRDGSLLTQTSQAYAPSGKQLYDAQRQAVWNNNQRVLLARQSSAAVPLAGIVQALVVRTGLVPADLNTTSLTDEVRGYVVARPMTVRAALQPLASAFLFDAVESDDVLRFVKRGGATVATILWSDMLREGDQPVTVRQRAQDLELPRALTIRHFDPERAYELGAQRWTRPTQPTPVMVSRTDTTLDLALVLTPTEAKTLARRLLTATWRERTRLTFTGSTQHARLEPTDPVNVVLDDGSTVRARIVSTQLGADYRLRIEAVPEDPTDYSLTAVAYGGEGRLPDAIPVVMPVRGFAPNLPLLRDSDAPTAGIRGYLFAGGFDGAGAWYGAEAWREQGGSRTFLDTFPGGAPWGSTTTALPVPRTYWTWDDANSLTIRPVYGADEIASATDVEVLNGENLAALITSTGAVELIQWATAVLNGDGTITLSRLLRGRKGTEDAGAIPVGSSFVMVTGYDLAILSDVAMLNVSETFRFASPGIAVSASPAVSRTNTGRSLEPWAPVLVRGSRDGSNNLTITAKRRTRFGGEWNDFVGTVPLNEAAEGYELEIRNAADSATVRVVTGLTTPSFVYSAANQSADGLTPGNPVIVRWYQTSAVTGRGIMGRATV